MLLVRACVGGLDSHRLTLPRTRRCLNQGPDRAPRPHLRLPPRQPLITTVAADLCTAPLEERCQKTPDQIDRYRRSIHRGGCSSCLASPELDRKSAQIPSFLRNFDDSVDTITD